MCIPLSLVFIRDCGEGLEIIDEPTNDLDIQTLMILEEYLDSFQGIVVAVSHDRYFLDRVARRMLAFEEDGAVVQYEGGFTDYQAAYERRHPAASEAERRESSAKPAAKEQRTHEKKLKFSYKEQKEWESIESDIEALEEKLAELEQQEADAAGQYTKLQEVMAEKDTVQALLDEKMERWMYLNELAEKIAAQ